MSDTIWNSFNLSAIEKLADIINEKELSEISLTDGGKTITVKGKKAVMPPMPPMSPMMPQAPVQTAGEAVQSEPAHCTGNKVLSPIVGTFYSAPSPKDSPFVSVGSQVKKGDVIFIIESMKVMSEIQSEFDGVVKEICVSNGDPIEFGQTIMIIG